ncbi:hypothetical protein ABZX98_05660 [Streptomyces sp. NPDC002992]|uniref:hypothetical protein n=1 Tax=Streptomyces sp. NPDC002992 TaxID=3154273 RepID=UPI0033B87227
MTTVTRLVTYVELDEAATDTRHVSVTARLEAVCADDRSLVLLDDRGWSWSSSAPMDTQPRISAEEIEKDARTVVGPDEPIGGETPEQMAAGHWNFLADVLKRQGVDVETRELERLSHDVVLSEPLRALIRDH